MIAALSITAFLSLGCFVVGCIRRIRQYRDLPLHLRWELYPVPHESRRRASYGGSYFEESEWWTKPRANNRAGEVRVMAEEIFAFNSVRESNPNLWWRTLAFHGGMYGVVAFVLLEAMLGLMAPRMAALELYTIIIGRVGVALIFFGSCGLLWRRIADKRLRDYTHAADYAHLAAISVTSIVILVGTLSVSAPAPRELVYDVLTLNTRAHVPIPLGVGLIVSFVVLAYVPYSHMAHFIAKYFTFHAIRWDDEPNVDDRLRGPISRNLKYKPNWWAAHIGADGTKSWAEIATHNPAEVKEIRS